MTKNELFMQMVNDKDFQFKKRLHDVLSRFSYDEIIPAYNHVMASVNVEDKDYGFTLTYEQLELVNMVFLTTSLYKYEHAFGTEWVKSHLRHHRKTDLCITLRPDGFIETLKTYTNIDFISFMIDYWTRSDTSLSLFNDRIGSSPLDIRDDFEHIFAEYANIHNIDMTKLDVYTPEEEKERAEMGKALNRLDEGMERYEEN